VAEAYWQIGDARLYEDGRRLTGPQGTKSLRPQQYAVLRALLENKGHTTKKEMLMKLLWGKQEIEYEHRLQTLISELRHVLGKSYEVKNIFGEGYRWTGSAERIAPAEENPASLHQTGVAATPEPQRTIWGSNDYQPPRICVTICITGITAAKFISDQLIEEVLKMCLTPGGTSTS
jgi:DNA-binding winged helix-turn-helix (wHTH) protein